MPAKRPWLTLALAAFLLGGCAGNNVVVEPVAVRPVAARLVSIPDVPKCDLPERADYTPEEVKTYAQCWRAAYDALFSKHKGLIKAVMARERSAAKAVKMAKS